MLHLMIVILNHGVHITDYACQIVSMKYSSSMTTCWLLRQTHGYSEMSFNTGMIKDMTT